jgi:4-oxalmesaconate hydratase
MIVDSHAHIVMPVELNTYVSELVSSRANPAPGKGGQPSDEVVRAAAAGLTRQMDAVGTDVQFLSPRPYMQMHSIKPAAVTSAWTRVVNDVIHRQVTMFPARFKGVAGLPQFRDTSPQNTLEELDRCVTELGFVGCLINPDPMEGDGTPPPGLGDRFWYPLYEKLVELDVPALVHSAGCCHPREPYTLKFINEESIAVISLLTSTVFEDFPTLKIIIPHGGGAIPYQMGRFRAWHHRRNLPGTFDDKLRSLYFDTCNYAPEALELLFRIVGTDNVLFATERPGTGSVMDPSTGKMFDDLKPIIEGIGWLDAAAKFKIFEGNARKLYPRAFVNPQRA